MIITVDYKYSEEAVRRMCNAVDDQIMRNSDLNGMEYTIERADYTSMKTDDGHDPDPDGVKLFRNVIQPTLDVD